MEEHRFDLHLHSDRSDGADAPEAVVQKAKQNGVALIALTDHDTIDGVADAQRAGRQAGVAVLPAMEMDAEWPSEMHILGLDMDVGSEALNSALETAKQRRIARNRVIFDKLRAAGYDAEPYLMRTIGSVTKLHIALALVSAGYAKDASDAFGRFLRRGCPGYYTVTRFSPEEVVSIIRAASGVPVWAHPFHGGGNLHAEWDMLAACGVGGVEAYHPSATEGQSAILVSLAQQRGMLVTCGSDSHGAYRRSAAIGCTWRDTKPLAETYEFFMDRTRST